MIFYAIDRNAYLSKGRQLELLKTPPSSLINYSMENLFSQNDLSRHAEKIFPEGLSYFGWRYLRTRFLYGDTASGFSIDEFEYLTEMNVEHTRRIFFSDAPSRWQSIFACESLADAQKLKIKLESPEAPIFEVSSEIFFRADMNLLHLGINNIAASFLAFQYWSEKASSNPFWEYILPLPVKVLNRVE